MADHEPPQPNRWIWWALNGEFFVSRIDPQTGRNIVVRVTDRQEGERLLRDRARALAEALNRVYAGA